MKVLVACEYSGKVREAESIPPPRFMPGERVLATSPRRNENHFEPGVVTGISYSCSAKYERRNSRYVLVHTDPTSGRWSYTIKLDRRVASARTLTFRADEDMLRKKPQGN